jgi:hypothetical protein
MIEAAPIFGLPIIKESINENTSELISNRFYSFLKLNDA